jgi:hypothetical protein
MLIGIHTPNVPKTLLQYPVSLKPQVETPRRRCSEKHLHIRVDSDGSPPVTLGTPLDGKKGEWLRKWPPPAARARVSAQTGHPDHATGRLHAHAP